MWLGTIGRAMMKSKDELRSEWIQMAPAWIKECREGRNSIRRGLLDTAILGVIGEVKGLKVLDSGCGEGRFAVCWQRGEQNTY
jgi:2-polyprenyl-3-methyl-5-hydroxy-6-metoxy-1,4-benzoquinol methylase